MRASGRKTLQSQHAGNPSERQRRHDVMQLKLRLLGVVGERGKKERRGGGDQRRRAHNTDETGRSGEAKAGYERTLREHTYEKRFRDIFKAMGI